MSTTEKLQHKFDTLFPHLNERQQHLVAAFDAQQLGRGGISIVSRVTGFSRPTIYPGHREPFSTPPPRWASPPLRSRTQGVGPVRPPIASSIGSFGRARYSGRSHFPVAVDL